MTDLFHALQPWLHLPPAAFIAGFTAGALAESWHQFAAALRGAA